MSKELQDRVQHLSGRCPLNVMGNIHTTREKASEGRDGFQKAPKEKHNGSVQDFLSSLGKRFLNMPGFQLVISE